MVRPVKRFTVSLAPEDYERLRELAESQEPPVSLRYMVEYAIRRFLRTAEDPQIRLQLNDR